MTSILADRISGRSLQSCDKTNPPKLEVILAEYGDFAPWSHGAARVDPVYLALAKVEPRSTVEFLNLSENPGASWGKDKKPLAIGDNSVSLPTGKIAVAFSNKDLKALGILPGDVIALRQIDAAGNASEPTVLRLNQHGAGGGARNTLIHVGSGVDRFEPGTSGLRNDNYEVFRYKDPRPPVGIPELMRWSGKACTPDRQLIGDQAVEPGATVIVQNQRTLESQEATVNDEGDFEVPFKAECGDPISVRIRDAHGLVTDMGVTPLVVEHDPKAGQS